MLELSPAQLVLVREILQRTLPDNRVWVFGSRANGPAKPWSDLDLALQGEQALSPAKLAELSTAFTESDLPFRVDIVDLATVSASFRAIIEAQRVALD